MKGLADMAGDEAEVVSTSPGKYILRTTRRRLFEAQRRRRSKYITCDVWLRGNDGEDCRAGDKGVADGVEGGGGALR